MDDISICFFILCQSSFVCMLLYFNANHSEQKTILTQNILKYTSSVCTLESNIKKYNTYVLEDSKQHALLHCTPHHFIIVDITSQIIQQSINISHNRIAPQPVYDYRAQFVLTYFFSTTSRVVQKLLCLLRHKKHICSYSVNSYKFYNVVIIVLSLHAIFFENEISTDNQLCTVSTQLKCWLDFIIFTSFQILSHWCGWEFNEKNCEQNCMYVTILVGKLKFGPNKLSGFIKNTKIHK